MKTFTIARLLLTDDEREEFKKLLIRFYEGEDKKSFCHSKEAKRYTRHISLWDEEELTEGLLLYGFVIEKEIIDEIDWQGEEGEGQLEHIITKQLERKNIYDFDWDFLEKFEDEIEWDKLEPGDYIYKKFVVVDEHLQKRHLRLAFFNPLGYSDSYIPFVVAEKDFYIVRTLNYDPSDTPGASLSNLEDGM